jgi:hypothetical protein
MSSECVHVLRQIRSITVNIADLRFTTIDQPRHVGHSAIGTTHQPINVVRGRLVLHQPKISQEFDQQVAR